MKVDSIPPATPIKVYINEAGLAHHCGVSKRTISHYVSKELLPPPTAADGTARPSLKNGLRTGPKFYPLSIAPRVRLIKQLQGMGLYQSEIYYALREHDAGSSLRDIVMKRAELINQRAAQNSEKAAILTASVIRARRTLAELTQQGAAA